MVPALLQVLKLELKEIRAQQDLLFRFMSFLKQEGAVHVLQFCLTVGKPLPLRTAHRARVPATTQMCPCPPEEFNERILCPDLSQAELQRLHAELLHIHQTYCLEDSLDHIRFNRFILEDIRRSKSTPTPPPRPRRQLRQTSAHLHFHQSLKVTMATW